MRSCGPRDGRQRDCLPTERGPLDAPPCRSEALSTYYARGYARLGRDTEEASMRVGKIVTFVGMITLATGGCTSSRGGGTGSTSVAMAAGAGELGPALLQWTGRFQATQQQTGDVATHAMNQTTGLVTLTAAGPNQTRVQLTVSGPMLDPVQLPWAMASGACRSGSIPLMAVAQFPEITMSNGRGELDAVFSMPMPTTGTYHVNVYNGSTSDESGVMACAELKLGRKDN